MQSIEIEFCDKRESEQEGAAFSSITLTLTLSLVELAGFEPASKQAAKMLSTCLSLHYLSGKNR